MNILLNIDEKRRIHGVFIRDNPDKAMLSNDARMHNLGLSSGFRVFTSSTVKRREYNGISIVF